MNNEAAHAPAGQVDNEMDLFAQLGHMVSDATARVLAAELADTSPTFAAIANGTDVDYTAAANEAWDMVPELTDATPPQESELRIAALAAWAEHRASDTR